MIWETVAVSCLARSLPGWLVMWSSYPKKALVFSSLTEVDSCWVVSVWKTLGRDLLEVWGCVSDVKTRCLGHIGSYHPQALRKLRRGLGDPRHTSCFLIGHWDFILMIQTTKLSINVMFCWFFFFGLLGFTYSWFSALALEVCSCTSGCW